MRWLVRALGALVLLCAFTVTTACWWWTREPALQTAPSPWASRPVYVMKNVSGFKLSLGKKSWVLPPGSQLYVPVHVAPADSIPDWTKV